MKGLVRLATVVAQSIKEGQKGTFCELYFEREAAEGQWIVFRGELGMGFRSQERFEDYTEALGQLQEFLREAAGRSLT